MPPMGLALKQLVAHPAGTLDELHWLLPIIGPGGSGFGTTLPAQTVTRTMGGDASVTYLVTFRFRGVVEQKTYTGGTNDGAFWQVGGTPASDNWNIYSLATSSPSAIYYLNRGTSGQFVCYGIDYTKTISIRGGATVTLVADPVDSGPYEIYNSSTGPPTITPISVSGILTPAQPYNGQFIQMDVISVV